MAVLLLGVSLVQGDGALAALAIPFWLMLLCSAVMAAGTVIGGRRIIKTIGMDMVKLEPYQGFSADSAAALSLLLASAFGLPVSTTHTKTTAVMGVGAARRISGVKWNLAEEMAATWILTFPGCCVVGYVMAFVFLEVFH